MKSNFFKGTVDTGGPAFFVNKRTAEYIAKSVPSAVVLDEKECPIDMVYVNYNPKRNHLFGTLIVNVSSLGWNVKSAKFLISENRTLCLLELDLHSQLVLPLTQVRPPIPLVGVISQSESSETSQFWISQYKKKFSHVFSRIGRAKNHQLFSTFKSQLIPIQEKGRQVPAHIQVKVREEIRKLIQEGHIVKQLTRISMT